MRLKKRSLGVGSRLVLRLSSALDPTSTITLPCFERFLFLKLMSAPGAVQLDLVKPRIKEQAADIKELRAIRTGHPDFFRVLRFHRSHVARAYQYVSSVSIRSRFPSPT